MLLNHESHGACKHLALCDQEFGSRSHGINTRSYDVSSHKTYIRLDCTLCLLACACSTTCSAHGVQGRTSPCRFAVRCLCRMLVAGSFTHVAPQQTILRRRYHISFDGI